MDFIEQAEAFITQNPLLLGILAGVAVFLAIGLRLIFKQPPAHLTAFSGNAGSVLVSRKALQELIKQAGLLDEWVEAARPIVRVKDSKVSAKVELRLAAPESLKAVCERVQNRITSLLQQSLGFDQIGEIQIVVKSFSPNEESNSDILLPKQPAPKETTVEQPASNSESHDDKPELS